MRNETTRLAVQTKVMRRKPSVLLLLLLLKKVTHAQQTGFVFLREKVFCGQKTVKKREEGFSLFFREEYPAPERRAYSLRKKREREKGKETEGGRTLPMNRFTSVSLRAHASTTRRRLRLLFVFPLSLSLKIRERARREKKKTRENVKVEEWKGEGVRGRLRFHV